MTSGRPLRSLDGLRAAVHRRLRLFPHTSLNQELKAPSAESPNHISLSLYIHEQTSNCSFRAHAHTYEPTCTCAHTCRGIISALPAVVSIICPIALKLKWQVDMVCGDFAVIKLSERRWDLSWFLRKINQEGNTQWRFLKQLSTLSLLGGKLWNCSRKKKKAGKKYVPVRSHLQSPIIAPSGSNCCLLPNITVIFYFPSQF